MLDRENILIQITSRFFWDLNLTKKHSNPLGHCQTETSSFIRDLSLVNMCDKATRLVPPIPLISRVTIISCCTGINPIA